MSGQWYILKSEINIFDGENKTLALTMFSLLIFFLILGHLLCYVLIGAEEIFQTINKQRLYLPSLKLRFYKIKRFYMTLDQAHMCV